MKARNLALFLIVFTMLYWSLYWVNPLGMFHDEEVVRIVTSRQTAHHARDFTINDDETESTRIDPTKNPLWQKAAAQAKAQNEEAKKKTIELKATAR